MLHLRDIREPLKGYSKGVKGIRSELSQILCTSLVESLDLKTRYEKEVSRLLQPFREERMTFRMRYLVVGL